MTTTSKTTDTPFGEPVPVVERVAKTAAFQFGWNGFEYFLTKQGLVAVRGAKAGV